ncbi:MAG: CoA-binding protein, partial [archaeon]|nr:CoA-binding protein [archaeon]
MIDIKKFFNPRTIAVIGASDHSEKVGGILSQKIRDSKATLVPINPNHEQIFGVKCYKNVLDYKGTIDLAIIAVPSLFVVGALNECATKKIKDVIIISAGFSEIGNVRGEQELRDVAKKNDINFIGPNCFGIFNPYKNLDATFSASTPVKGDIAFISQSGALWSYIADFSLEKNIGFSGFVSLGNMGDLEFSDFIEYFSKDSKTKSIILYIEKLKDGKKFISACRKCKKPIYVIKAGSSEEGSKAAFSHTASLASDYEIYKGAFSQAGVILCDSLIGAVEKIKKKEFVVRRKDSFRIGKKVFIITNAGGAGALLADYLSKKGFEIVRGPLDILGTATGSDYFNALEKIKNETFYESIIVVLT